MKPDLMKKILSAKDLHKLKMTDETNFITAHSVDIGTAANDLIKKMKQSELRVLAFKNEFLTFVKILVTKMLLKSPIKHKLVRSCTFLDPTVMVTEKANTLLICTLDELREAKRVTAIDCDAIKDEFADFVSTKMDRTLFSQYELTKSGRLDRYLHTHMKKHCPKLWMTVEIILTISHGQASVERGFSFNKEISVENLSQVSLIALSLRFFAKKNLKFCGQNAKFCKLKKANFAMLLHSLVSFSAMKILQTYTHKALSFSK